MKGVSVLFILLLLLGVASAQEEAVRITVEVSGQGSVHVEGAYRAPDGSYVALPSANVTLYPFAFPGWEFSHWESSDPTINGSTAVPLVFRARAVAVKAVFRRVVPEPDFVRVTVVPNVQVRIDYPQLVLRGKEVAISAPESAPAGREDVRYVFDRWELPGNVTVTTPYVVLKADRDLMLRVYYRTEFRFLGEWFPIERGVLITRKTFELGPGVRGIAECYRLVRLNVTLCDRGGGFYVPDRYVQDLEPVLRRQYLLTLVVEGYPDQLTVLLGGNSFVWSGEPIRVWLDENGTATVSVPPVLGDYELDGQAEFTVGPMTSPLTVRLAYRPTPLAPFAQPLRPVAALLLATPLGGFLQDMSPFAANLVVAAFTAAPPAIMLFAAYRAIRKKLGRSRHKEKEEVELPSLALSESPRQAGYIRRLVEQLRPAQLDLELAQLSAESEKAGPRPVTPRHPATGRRVSPEEAIKKEIKGAVLSYPDVVKAFANGMGESELEKLRSLGAVVMGSPTPVPLQIPEDAELVSIVGGDGRVYSLLASGATVIEHWSSNPSDIAQLKGPRGSRRQGLTVAIRWCDPLGFHELAPFIAAAESAGARLVLLYDGESADAPQPQLRLSPPSEGELIGVMVAESLSTGSQIRWDRARDLVRRISGVPGLQYALARACGADPENPLRALPQYTDRFGPALSVLQRDPKTLLSMSREKLQDLVLIALKAYGAFSLYKYHEMITGWLVEVVRAVEGEG